MLFTISTTHSPATDLGYLLHKHPGRALSFDLSFGKAHCFYPEATAERCTAALLLEIDPVGLSRKGSHPSGGPLQPYVNDRPYVASSFLSVAIAEVFGTALAGRSRERPELAERAFPLEARVAVVAARGGEAILRKLFEPLGYDVEVRPLPLDELHPEWGPSSLFSLRLRADKRLKDLLAHLYVMIPVLDDEKHYWVGADEIDKLLRHGEGWLAEHPERDFISRRYLKHQRSLVRQALDRLVEEDDPEEDGAEPGVKEPSERELSLNEQRLGAVLAALKGSGAKRVVDLGCGEGKLLKLLLDDPSFERVAGVDVALRALEIAGERLHLERLPPAKRSRIELLHGSLLYRDKRLAGFDAAAVVEVVEHLDPERLSAFARVVFEHARPRTIVLTTPNAEYNVRFEGLPAGKMRHGDHRFEWGRAEFETWSREVAGRYGYEARFVPVGNVDPEVGPPTQMAVFGRKGADA
jgi:3' terminal RNA ribose 2'-O-methyltransferase Hen1